MPAAARSRLCSRGSAWAGIFARSAISSAKSASVIVFAGYFLLLSFVSLKPFTWILSIDVLSRSEFKSHWVPHSYVFEPHLSKKPCKFLNVL